MMKTEIISFIVGLTILINVFAVEVSEQQPKVSYGSAKVEYEQLTKEIKEIDRQLEKTRRIQCYNPFQKMVAFFLNIFPLPKHMQDGFFVKEKQCVNHQQGQFRKLSEKVKIKKDRVEEALATMKSLHPLQEKTLNEKSHKINQTTQ
ncbi:uncharacterized protein [Fopius arisanus]|uniref:Uncharacterized protein n=1 Tax=Fopius arisanus TaxID=64838 RepID=A0A9R1T6K3_9HYME|nr:PREDICTED: uncharacterized protein LOC105266899 [Fopius arisanus]